MRMADSGADALTARLLRVAVETAGSEYDATSGAASNTNRD